MKSFKEILTESIDDKLLTEATNKLSEMIKSKKIGKYITKEKLMEMFPKDSMVDTIKEMDMTYDEVMCKMMEMCKDN